LQKIFNFASSNQKMNSYSTLLILNQTQNIVPGQRFRIEQYIDELHQHNISTHISPHFYPEEANIVYAHGKIPQKTLLFLKMLQRRQADYKALKQKQHDIVFIYREALYGPSVYFEKKYHRSGVPIIFDFDDAIWFNDTSDANKKLSFLKKPQKTASIIALSDLVIAGNNYLADYAKQFNPNTVVIPTTIDTDYHKPLETKSENNKKVIIGWSGSMTTVKHFNTLIPVLKTIRHKYPFVDIKFIGEQNYRNEELNIQGIAWKYETEIQDLHEFDIGIMPLPDDKWSKGKCGFKGLSFMAMEIPTIMSPVGVNTEIIQDGQNGFLANEDNEWIEKLSLLIESVALRKQLGKAGRQTVIEKYSVEANKHKWVQAFQSVLHDKT